MPLSRSPHARRLQPSPTLEIKAVADRLRATGHTVFDFGIGEMNPEIPLPAIIRAGITEALRSNATHYSPQSGDPELLAAIAQDLDRFGLQYTEHQIVVCPGPKDAIFKLALTLLDPTARRRRVVIFTPSYESFESIPVLVTGDDPIALPTDARFLPDPERLATLLATDDTIAIVILNSPNNPTGAVYDRDRLQALAEVLARHPDVAVISDEVYRTILFDDAEYASIATLLPEQTFVIGGMSKEASGTGLRLGFVAGPQPSIETLAIVQGNATSCVNLPTQKGYARFLREDADRTLRHAIRDELLARRDRLLAGFAAAAPEAVWHAPRGAFYFFPDLRAYLGRRDASGHVVTTDLELSRYLLETSQVVATPGSLFQCAGHLRFAFARSFETIECGMQRLGEALAGLRR